MPERSILHSALSGKRRDSAWRDALVRGAARGKCPTRRVLPCSSKGLNTYVQRATPQRFPCRTRRCFGPCSRCGSLWKIGEMRKSRVDFRVCSPYSSELSVRHSAGQGGLSLFDNRYDVPESVRNHSALFEPEWLSNIERSTICLGRLAPIQIGAFFFAQATGFKREFDPGSERTLAACLTHASRVRGCSNTTGARRTGA